MCSNLFNMATNGNGESNGYTTGTGQEKINTEIITLTRFLTEEQTKHKEATGDFTYAQLFRPQPQRRID